MTVDNLHERMVAYLDGEMGPAESEAFERECEANPALAAELARFAQNDALLHEAFDAPVDEPVDPALLARMGLSDVTPTPTPANDDTPGWKKWGLPVGGMIAASLAVVLLFSGPTSPTPFDRALDGTASGQLASLENGATMRPVLSFQAADGRYCREYVVSAAGDDASGIACRTDERWQIEFAGGPAARLADPTQIEVASGADGASLDQVYERLGASDPLGVAHESALITEGWNR